MKRICVQKQLWTQTTARVSCVIETNNKVCIFRARSIYAFESTQRTTRFAYPAHETYVRSKALVKNIQLIGLHASLKRTTRFACLADILRNFVGAHTAISRGRDTHRCHHAAAKCILYSNNAGPPMQNLDPLRDFAELNLKGYLSMRTES